MRLVRLLAALIAAVVLSGPVWADDGYRLWLRYDLQPEPLRTKTMFRVNGATAESKDERVLAAARELNNAVFGLTGIPANAGVELNNGQVLLGTPASSETIRNLNLDLSGLGDEGYVAQTVSLPSGVRTIVVAANNGAGVLYGTFALIREMQLGHPLDNLNLRSAPKLRLRVLDHWDNLNGHIERGYAGDSLWDWWKLPDYKDPRYTDYARASASVGINGAVLNNVNAVAASLTPDYIAKAAALADVFRPWGIKVYLSARFTAPMELGHLKTADPLDPPVSIAHR